MVNYYNINYSNKTAFRLLKKIEILKYLTCLPQYRINIQNK